MTRESDPGPGGPPVSHIGGGSSRRAAVLVVGVLAAVVWVGASARPAAPTTTPVPVAVGLESPAATPSPSAQSERDLASPRPLATVEPSFGNAAPTVPGVDVPADIFGAYLELGGREFITILDETQPGRLEGRLQLPDRLPARDGIFAFDQLSPTNSAFSGTRIGDWPITIGQPTEGGSGDELLVNEFVAGRSEADNAPGPVVRGYLVIVYAVDGSRQRTLGISVLLGLK